MEDFAMRWKGDYMLNYQSIFYGMTSVWRWHAYCSTIDQTENW